MSILFGITGYIGSGKTTIAHGLEELGEAVYYSDLGARRIMLENAHVREELVTLLGRDIYAGGELNRAAIAAKIFQDKSLLRKVNSIVHPAVCNDVLRWSKRLNRPYCFVESAILFTSGLRDICSGVILVNAPEELIIRRAMERDDRSREEVLSRLISQREEEFNYKAIDLILSNDGTESITELCLRVQRFCSNFAGQ